MNSPCIPDSIIMANIRGTHEVPQVYAAAAIYVGAVATPLLLEGKVAWSDLQFGAITDKQADRIGLATNVAHNTYGMPLRFSADRPEGITDQERANGAPELISRDQLRTLNASGIFNMANTTLMFALGSSPELQNVFPTGEALATTGSFHDLSNPVLHEFFTNADYQPRILALQGLWNRSRHLLREETFLKQAKDYRIGMSEKYNTAADHPHRAAMESRIRHALLTRLEPEEVRQAIKEESDYLIPSSVARAFANTVSDSLRHMPLKHFTSR